MQGKTFTLIALNSDELLHSNQVEHVRSEQLEYQIDMMNVFNQGAPERQQLTSLGFFFFVLTFF